MNTTIGVGQFPAAPGDVEANLGVLLEQLESAGGAELDLMCFPELCLPGYLLAAADYTDSLRQDLLRAEQTIQRAAAAAGVRIVYGTARWENAGLRNCVVVASRRRPRRRTARCTSRTASEQSSTPGTSSC